MGDENIPSVLGVLLLVILFYVACGAAALGCLYMVIRVVRKAWFT